MRKVSWLQIVTNSKMRSPKDGKRYNTDVASTEQTILKVIDKMYAKMYLQIRSTNGEQK